MESEYLTMYVGIIAGCMVIITLTVIVVGLQTFKTMKRTHLFLESMQHELGFISTKAALTFHEFNEFLGYLKIETSSLGAKSSLALEELHEMINYIHVETKSLAYKASAGIAKVTLGSLVIDGLFKFIQKDKKK